MLESREDHQFDP
ncbi:hypothetical protein AYI70_g4356, partial [Smittium culicis]